MGLSSLLLGMALVSAGTADQCASPENNERTGARPARIGQPLPDRWVALELMRLELESLERAGAERRRNTLSRRIKADQRALATDMDRVLRVAARPPTCRDSQPTESSGIVSP